MNKVILTGRIASEPVLYETGTGNVTKFNLACKKFGQKKQADFFRCVSFKKQADYIAAYFHVGDSVIIEGRLSNRQFLISEKEKPQIVTEIMVIEIELMRHKGEKAKIATVEHEPIDPGFEEEEVDDED